MAFHSDDLPPIFEVDADDAERRADWFDAIFFTIVTSLFLLVASVFVWWPR